jgi:IS30 family transposase
MFILLPPKVTNMKHLTLEQRYEISAMYKNGALQKDIAKALQKDKSTISRELKRNRDGRNGQYRASLAQTKCERRHKEKPKKVYFTVEIQQFIDEWINEEYSPEQIAGRAILQGFKCVSVERIYQYVWDDKKHGGILYKKLRRKGRKYRNRGASKDSRGVIKNRIAISERPKIVEERTRLGDFEIDTIIGKNHKGAILTINDRVSGYVLIEKLNGKDANELALKAIEILTPFKEWIKTITADNGKEFAYHETISEALNLDFYFARPYHSWERGSNENTNGLIRQYFIKGRSFEDITNQDVEYVQHKLNNRPRKRLGFLTPNEFLSLNLQKQKVAFNT